MKVLTTSRFVEAVKKLPDSEQQIIFHLFELASQFTTKDLLDASFVKVLVDSDEGRIFELRAGNIRIYCTIEKIEGIETAILIGLEKEGETQFPFSPSSTILIGLEKDGEPQFPFSPGSTAKREQVVRRPVLAISMVVVMMAIVLGVLWGVTKITSLGLVLSVTIILLLPLVVIFTLLVLGLARADDGIRALRDIVLSGVRGFSNKDKDGSDEDYSKRQG